MIGTALAIGAATWGVVMALSPLLQIRKMLARRSSEDVSIGYFWVLIVGFVLWLAYGASIKNLTLVIPNAVALVVALITVAVAGVLRTRGERGHGP
jgi:MtN3 and saliva related transmembrane protein